MKRILIAAGAAILMISLTGCGSYDTENTTVTLRYGGGIAEGKQFKECIAGGEHNNITNGGDSYYPYPTSDSDYDATGQKGSDAQPFESVSKDSVNMKIPMVITFDLKTDCKTLQKFHEKLGFRYRAFMEEDEDTGDLRYSSGWQTLLRKKMGDPVDTTLDRIVQNNNWRSVWNDPKVKSDIEDQVKTNMVDLVTRASGGESYFENFTVLIKKPEPEKQDLADAIASTQTEVSKSEAETAKAKADEAKARAQVAVARAESAKKRAEIEGFRLPGMTSAQAVAAYNEAKMIEAELNPRQPTYLVNGTQR